MERPGLTSVVLESLVDGEPEVSKHYWETCLRQILRWPKVTNHDVIIYTDKNAIFYTVLQEGKQDDKVKDRLLMKLSSQFTEHCKIHEDPTRIYYSYLLGLNPETGKHDVKSDRVEKIIELLRADLGSLAQMFHWPPSTFSVRAIGRLPLTESQHVMEYGSESGPLNVDRPMKDYMFEVESYDDGREIECRVYKSV